MRTVVDTAKQIAALISKLSLKSPQPVIAKPQKSLDIHALVEEVVASDERRCDCTKSVWERREASLDSIFGKMRGRLHQVTSEYGTQCSSGVGPVGSIFLSPLKDSRAVPMCHC